MLSRLMHAICLSKALFHGGDSRPSAHLHSRSSACSVAFAHEAAALAVGKCTRGRDAKALCSSMGLCGLHLSVPPSKTALCPSHKGKPSHGSTALSPNPTPSLLKQPPFTLPVRGFLRCHRAGSVLGKPVPWPLVLHWQQPLRITRSPSASLLLNRCLFTRGILNSSSNLNKKVSLLFVSSLSRAATFKWFSSSPFISECTRREGIGSLLIKNKRWWHYNQCRVVIITMYLHFHRALALGCLWYKAAVLCALIEWNYFINTRSPNPRKDPFRGEDMGRVVGRWGARWAQFLADQFCLWERFLCSLQNCLSSTSGFFFFPLLFSPLPLFYKSNEWSDHPLLILWFSAFGLDYKSPMATSSAYIAGCRFTQDTLGKTSILPCYWLLVPDTLPLWLGHSYDF